MPRISNSTFKVNDDLQQQMEISAIANGLSIPITVNSALSVTSNIVGVDDSAKTSLSTTASALQTGIYGWDGSNWRQVNVSNGGNVKVESELEAHSGSQGNLANADSYTNASNSVAIDVSNKTLLTCLVIYLIPQIVFSPKYQLMEPIIMIWTLKFILILLLVTSFRI